MTLHGFWGRWSNTLCICIDFGQDDANPCNTCGGGCLFHTMKTRLRRRMKTGFANNWFSYPSIHTCEALGFHTRPLDKFSYYLHKVSIQICVPFSYSFHTRLPILATIPPFVVCFHTLRKEMFSYLCGGYENDLCFHTYENDRPFHTQ